MFEKGMIEMKKKVIVILIIVVMVGGLILKKNSAAPKTIPESNEQNVVVEKIIIEIKGEIYRPGIYICSSEDRVYSVINLAGGLTSFAEVSSLNLAQKVIDGMVIVIPKRDDSKECPANKISINQASLHELMSLKGIGEARAKSIIDYREINGPFTRIEELLKINGISENIFNQIKDDICL